MFPRIGRNALALAGLLTLGACAGASLAPNTPRHIGRGTQYDILNTVPTVLNRFGYTIANHRETASIIVFETAWEHRQPFEDEVRIGADAVRTRLTVEARKAGVRTYSVTLRVENDALGSTAEHWGRMEPTEMFEKHIRQITTGIRDEIDAGLRVF